MSVSYQIARLLAEQFYRWELRGRGWDIFPDRIRLEPPFRPFNGHYVSSSVVEDDGRVPTLGSRFAKKLLPFFVETQHPFSPMEVDDEEPDPETQNGGAGLVEMQIALPRDYEPKANVFEQFLFSVGYASNPIAFEVVGCKKELVVQVVADPSDALMIRQQLKAFFPEAIITAEENYLRGKVYEIGDSFFVALEFGLEREFVVPINNLKSLPADPLVAVCGALDKLRDEEVGVFQVLIEPARSPWATSMLSSVTLWDGKPFFANAPELVEQTRQKISRPLFAVVLRIGAFAQELERRAEMIKSLAGAMRPLTNTQGNQLILLTNDDYGADEHEKDLLSRTSHRTGMLLNSDELIALAHLPTAAVRASSLRRALQKTRAAPSEVCKNAFGIVIGENLHEGVSVEVRLPLEARLNHCHILGGTGTGKSTLLSGMAVQDILAGHGLAVIDPHGDLIETILPHIPSERLDDVILFDPTDEEYAIAFNPLAARSDRERELVASDFIAVMKQHTSSWGDQMSSLLGNAVLAFLQSSRGGTLPELRRFFSDPTFRAEFLKSVTNSEVVYFWEKEAGFANKSAIGSILTRLDALLRHESVLHILGQKQNRLDFAEIMDSRKIFLARLAKGLIGDSNAYILGGLLVARFYQTAIARQRLRQEARQPFMLIMDEAGELLTSTVSEILIGTRKYGLGLTLAHQSLRQLSGSDEIYGAVTGSCRTKICFQVGGDDARKMADEFAEFTATDLMSLPTLHAVARVGTRNSSFNLKVSFLPDAENDPVEAYNNLLGRTRARYSTPREAIRKDIEALRMPRTGGMRVDPFADITAKRKREREQKVQKSEEAETPAAISGASFGPAKPNDDGSESTEASSGSFEERATAAASAKGEAIKNTIIQAAGNWGYTYETEQDVLNKTGRVDIVLNLGKTVVACEISATTPAHHEVDNILKCLKAGFIRIVHVCDVMNRRKRIEQMVSGRCTLEERARIEFLTVKQLIGLLGTLAEAEKRETDSVSSAIGKTVIGETNELTPDQMKQLSQDVWDQISKNKARDRKRRSE